MVAVPVLANAKSWFKLEFSSLHFDAYSSSYEFTGADTNTNSSCISNISLRHINVFYAYIGFLYSMPLLFFLGT